MSIPTKRINLIDEIVLNAKLKDMNPIFIERIKYLEGYATDAFLRNFTTVLYMESGSGILKTSEKTIPFGKGDVVINPQGIAAKWEFTEDTVTICFGFDGELSADFRHLEPVFKSPPDIFNELVSIANCGGRQDVLASSVLMKWYYQLFPAKSLPANEYDYVTRAKEYIKENYMHQFKVEDIAKTMNINRSYLSRVFKKQTEKTVWEYLISVRLKEAKLLLNDGKNVTEAALRCGFSSQSYFSKAFKRSYGYAPKHHKKSDQSSDKNEK